jgi:hypothetical protein
LLPEHPAIVTEVLWQQVQDLLGTHKQNQGSLLGNRIGALLKGLLFCRACGCRMTPTHVTASGKRYRYYLCTRAQKGGRHRCPAPSIAAVPVEQVVLEQLKDMSQECAPLQMVLDGDWPARTPIEQARALRLLIERVDYDGSSGKLVLTLRPRGPQQLARELSGAAP